MKKKFLKRALLGIPIGIAIGQIISIVISFIIGKGSYQTASPELIITLGNEINAVILQTLLYGVIGFIYAGTSIIWNKDSWGLMQKTFSVFAIYFITMLPIASVLNWFKLSFGNIMLFILIFVAIFLSVWMVFYLYNKKIVSQMNDTLKDK